MSADVSAHLAVDHLVVAARSLEEGVAWCETELGVTPSPGGQHPSMGTHNRLLGLSSGGYPRSFLEIIAVDPAAAAPSRPRWFDLDGEATRAALASGPKLVQWVARTSAIEASVADLRDAGLTLDDPIAVERVTARGVLRWRIALMAGGCRPAGGAMPLVIEWGGEHPCDSLPASVVALERVELRGVSSALATRLGVDAALPMAPSADEPSTVEGKVGSMHRIGGRSTFASLVAELRTPLGPRRLSSPASAG